MNDIEAVVFVYQQTQPPYKHRVVNIHGEAKKKGEKHIATLDAAKWIENLLISGKGKMKMIEELCY